MTGTLTMRTSWTLCLALAASACAVQPGRSGPILVPDTAAIFGRVVDTVTLADGGQATLRELNGQHSIKVGNFSRVAVLRSSQQARVLRTEQINGNTVLLIAKSTRGCPDNLDVVSISARGIEVYELMQCRLNLSVERDGDDLNIDHIDVVGNSRFLTRRVFRDQQLYKLKRVRLTEGNEPPSASPRPGATADTATPANAAATARPGAPRAPGTIVGQGAPRYQPALPGAAPAAATAPVALAPPTSAPAPTPAPAAAPGSARVQAAAQPSTSPNAPLKAPPPRPKPLSGEVETTTAPIRVVLQD